MHSIKHFIWDFDGTLMDTYPNVIRYLRLGMQECGHDAPDVEIMEKMMTTIGYAIRYYSEKFDIPDLKERYRKYSVQEATDPIRVFPCVPEVLRQIRKMGGYNYIFTNRGDTIYPILERAGIENEFTEIVTADSPQFAMKPAPDVILYLMEKYGGNNENTVMIGDRVCDLESAYRAGCKTCHLLTPSVPQYPDCDFRVNDFTEMLTHLSNP
ncbi:MAG: HAD hydrolase-like protein [Clostridia bacterium]|nr:HAD hydrolase-like protein [Clostridia bacterium]